MPRTLTRDTEHAVVAGVAAGLAEHFDLDPILVRLGFVFLCFFGGSGVLLYLVAWVLIPRDVDLERRARSDPPAEPPAGDVHPGAGEAANTVGEASGSETHPDEPATAERVVREASEARARVVETVQRTFPERTGRGRLIFGMILIGFGMLFLLDRFLPFHWFWIWDLWPLGLIGVGVLMLLNARKEPAHDR